MSENGFHFNLVCPEFQIGFDEVEMAVIPGIEGDFGILPSHAPMISMLRSGVVEVHSSKEGNKRIFVRDGFAEVLAGDVVVLAEEIVLLDDLDPGELAQKIQNAREDVADAKDEETLEGAKANLEHLEQLEQAIKPN